MADDLEKLLDTYGPTPTKAKTNVVPSAKPPSADIEKLLDLYAATQTAPQQAPPEISGVASIQDRVSALARGEKPDYYTPPTRAEEIKTGIGNVAGYAANLPGRLANETGKNFRESAGLASEGLSDIAKANLGWGVVKTAGGVAGMALPFIPPMATEIGKGVTQATGNSAIGNRAEFVSNAMFPIPGTAAGSAIGGAIRSGASRVLPTGNAQNALMRAVQQGGGDVNALRARLEANPRLSIMDVSPEAQFQAMGIANQPGQGSTILRNAVKERMEGAPGAVQGAFDTTLGYTPDPVKLLDTLKGMAKARANEGFTAALSGAGPVDVGPVIKLIDSKVSPGIGGMLNPSSGIPLTPKAEALNEVRAMLTDGKSVLTDANQLHEMQSALRRKAQDYIASADGGTRQIGKELMDIRQGLVESIDKSAGGKYRPAQKQFADDMAVQDAFHDGLNVLRNSTGEASLSTRPEAWAKKLKDMSPDEVNALKQGARVAVDNELGRVRNAARKGEAITDAQFNQDKLRLLLGEKETNRLMAAMRDEKQIAETNNKLFAGSQTQPRMEAAKATQVRDVRFSPGMGTIPVVGEALGAFGGLPPGIATGAALIGGGIGMGAQKGLQFMDKARNTKLAQMLTARGPEAVQTLTNAAPQIPVMTLSPAHQAALLGFGVSQAVGNKLLQAGGAK